MSRRSLVTTVVAAAGLLVGIFAWNLSSAGSGLAFDTDTPQTTSASDRGIAISALSASYSGSRTLVRLRLDASESSVVEGIRGARIPAGEIRGGNALAATGDIRIAVDSNGSGEAVARMSPLVSGSESVQVTITGLDLQRADGSSTRITGSWTLDLVVPTDLAELLRTEDLLPQGPTSDQGVTLRVLGAVRSTTDTLVTFAVESGNDIVMLSAPTLIHDGKELTGIQVASSEGGRVQSYSFPRTAFGDDVVLSFGPFARRGDGAAEMLSFDLGSVIARNGLGPRFGERAAVDAIDLVEAPLGSIREVDFARATGSQGVNLIGITIAGNWNNVPETTLTLSSGHVLPIRGASSAYQSDSTGAIVAGFTRFAFPFSDAEQLEGVVAIAVAPPDVIVRGTWEVPLSARP